MYKIVFCGAHGTGKTTLAKILATTLNVEFLDRITRSAWENFGVEDFEKIPRDVRTVFQNYLMINQVTKEDEKNQTGFVVDRFVIDVLGYTLLSSNMVDSELEVFKLLTKERLKNYTHFIYTPIEFEVENERLRADISTRAQFDKIIKKYIDLWLGEGNYLAVTGSVEDRIGQIQNYLQ